MIGAGGHCRVVVSAARAAGLDPWRILDDQESAWGATILGVPVDGGLSLLEPGQAAHIAIGANSVRRRIAEARPDIAWTSVVHPASWVCSSAQIGAGALVCAGAVVQPEAVLGRHVIVNTCASIDHECVLEDYSQAAPGAALGGRVILKEEAYAGIGSSIHQGSELGAGATLGGGAFLKGRIPPSEVWVGVPARPIGRSKGA